jgi:hypothetical protein
MDLFDVSARKAHQWAMVLLARILGGIVWLVSAVLIFGGLATLAWVLSAAIAFMVALDAAVDFCALCFVVVRLDRLGLKLG